MATKRSTKSGRRKSDNKDGRFAGEVDITANDDGHAPDHSSSTTLEVVEPSEPMDVDKTEGASTTTGKKCHLLKMSAEIRQKIWKYAVKDDKEIIPTQVKDTSNKFWPHGAKEATNNKVNTNPPTKAEDYQPRADMITAVQLSLTCHQLYDEVAGTGLFYQVNDISFVTFKAMLTYLVAITPVRKNAIRSVTMQWHHDRWTIKHALTMLATCQGLRKLEVRVLSPMYWVQGYRLWPIYGNYDYLTSLRGLETFKLVELVGVKRSESLLLPVERVGPEQKLAELEKLNCEIGALVTQPRVAPVPIKKIRAAEEASRLNIYGEGRLGPDKKPSIIASRTRGQLQIQKTLNDFGLIQETEEHPKFSKFGDLLWDIKEITDSRELATSEGTRRIEVYVTWFSEASPSWEVLDRIINSANVLCIVRHYVRNPEAYDLGIAISTIKEFVENDPVKTIALENLATMVKRNESPEACAKAKRLLRSRAFR